MVRPNDRLRGLRERTASSVTPGEALTRAELADQVNAWVFEHRGRTVELTANYIGKLERGQISWPQLDYRDGLRGVLGARTDAELGLYRTRGGGTGLSPVVGLRVLLTSPGVAAGGLARGALPGTARATTTGAEAAATLARLAAAATITQLGPVPTVVGRAEIEQVRAAATLFGALDHSYGGGLVRAAVLAQVQYCGELLRARCVESLRPELFSAVGFLAHTSGFMAFDALVHDDARRMFGFALACAEAAGDWRLRAKVLSSMARQAIWCGDPDQGLTLVEFALVRADRLTPAMRAMLLTARARALAKLARVADTAETVGLADEQFARITSGGDEPAWMAYYDAAQHAGDTGHALFDLALHGRFTSEATARLSFAVEEHTPAFARSRVISEIKLATLTMHVGDPDRASDIGHHALAGGGTLTSRRALDDLRELRAAGAPHGGRAPVAALCQAITERLASTS